MFEQDKEEQEAHRRFTRRAAIWAAAQAGAFGLLAGRLFQLQVLENKRYAPLAEENRISLQLLAPKRGRILDRHGAVLADNAETFRVVLSPASTGDVRKTLQVLQKIVPLTPETAASIIKRASHRGRHASIVVASGLTFEQVAQINLLAPQLPGVRTDVSWRRSYPLGPSAAAVTGFTGFLDRSEATTDPVLRLPGVKTGRSGIEAALERELRGESGFEKVEIDARGHVVRMLDWGEPKAGQDIALAIDSGLQKQIYSRLEREARGVCVVIDVGSGDVLAMASAPSFNPSAEAEEAASFNAEQLLSPAVGREYTPGSIFKIVTAVAALRTGRITAGEIIECSGTHDFGGHTRTCWKISGHGPLDLAQALANSCDLYFCELVQRTGVEALRQAGRDLGLERTYEIGLAGELPGALPQERTRPRDAAGREEDKAFAIALGQDAAATPLQLAILTARVASGRAVSPRLVRLSGTPAAGPSALAVPAEALDAVREGLVLAVNGVGSLAGDAMLEKGRSRVAGMAGWTPRDQNRAPAGDGRSDTTAAAKAFIAYVPAGAPRFAAACVLEPSGDTVSPAGNAAALTRDVLDILLNAGPADPHEAAPQGDTAGQTGTIPGWEGR